MKTLQRVGVAVATTLLVAGCSFATTIDGFTLGGIEKCSGGITPVEPGMLSCDVVKRLAIDALDGRDAAHAPIAAVDMFLDGRAPGPIDVTGDGPPPTPNPPGPGYTITVFVFTLADGSKRAAGVLCVDGASSQAECAGIGHYPG